MFYYLYHMYISIPIDKFIKDDLLNTVFNFIYKKFINIYIYIYIDIPYWYFLSLNIYEYIYIPYSSIYIYMMLPIIYN